jgi:GAF domain-containing protein
MIDAHLDYCTVSLLDIPLKNNRNQVLGVLELANVQDTESGQVIPFDANLQQMMETFSSLAVAALEAYIREQDLRRKVQELRIDIDETRRQEYVNEIVNNELFQELWGKARSLRSRNRVGTDTPVLSDEEDVTSDDNALS